MDKNKASILDEIKNIQKYFLQHMEKYVEYNNLQRDMTILEKPDLMNILSLGIALTIVSSLVFKDYYHDYLWIYMFIILAFILCVIIPTIYYTRKKKAIQKRKIELDKKISKVYSELLEKYNAYENCIIPFELSNPHKIQKLIDILNSGENWTLAVAIKQMNESIANNDTSKWYYIKKGIKIGPITHTKITQLINSGEIKGSTKVWTSGMKNWVSATEKNLTLNKKTGNSINDSSKNFVDENILIELKKSNEHKDLLCLECGYSGPMGVGEKIVPLWIRVMITLPIILIVVGFILYSIVANTSLISSIIMGVIVYLIGKSINKRYYICPNCKTQLKNNK